MLIKKETIFDFQVEIDGMVYFITDDERPRTYTISKDDWEDFGKPLTLTITAQAGDLLNNKDSDGK